MKSNSRLHAAILLLLVSGCGGTYRGDHGETELPSPWSSSSGNIAGTGSVETSAFSGTLVQFWEQKITEKPTAPLTIIDNKLALPGSRKRLKFFDTKTGSLEGVIRTKGLAIASLTESDGLIFYAVGRKKHQLIAYNTREGRTEWQRSLKDATPGAIAVGTDIFASATSGRILSLDANSGEINWQFDCKERLVGGLSSQNGLLFQLGDRGHLFAVDIATGTLKYKTKLAASFVNTAAISEAGIVYACDVEGEIFAIEDTSGTLLWQNKLVGPIWSSPSLSQNSLVCANSYGVVFGLDPVTGSIQWQFETGEVVKSSPLIIGQFAIVGTLGGSLYVLSLQDGAPTVRYSLAGPISFSPVTDGQQIYLATEDGRVVCFRDAHEVHSKTDY